MLDKSVLQVDGPGFEPGTSTMPTWRSCQTDLPAQSFSWRIAVGKRTGALFYVLCFMIVDNESIECICDPDLMPAFDRSSCADYKGKPVFVNQLGNWICGGGNSGSLR